MAGLRLRDPGTAIERFYAHPPHQRYDMPAANLAPLGSQPATQDPRTGERKLQMQPIETPHDREIGVRHRARQVIDAATADLQDFRLLRDRQIVLAVDHRFALSNPAVVSARSEKSFFSVSSSTSRAATSFRSRTSGTAVPGPKSPEAPPFSSAFDAVI
ncbi:hypothetical protein ABIB00_007884 [Bradyrhizobium sp. LB14.3]